MENNLRGRVTDMNGKDASHISGWSSTLLHHDALPPFLKDNEYLKRHHRPQLNSILECVKSIFRMHTETGNIWTHLCREFLVKLVFNMVNCKFGGGYTTGLQPLLY